MSTEWVLKRLQKALSDQGRTVKSYFAEHTFEAEKRRLVSKCGKFALEWRTRLEPDKPKSNRNYEFASGIVLLVKL
jgi:hypothetical protein